MLQVRIFVSRPLGDQQTYGDNVVEKEKWYCLSRSTAAHWLTRLVDNFDSAAMVYARRAHSVSKQADQRNAITMIDIEKAEHKFFKRGHHSLKERFSC